MKKHNLITSIIITLCLILASVAKAENVLPKHIAEQFGELYVYHNGRVTSIQAMTGTTHRQTELMELFKSGQTLHLFPIADENNNIRWYSQAEVLPLNISDEEWTFVKKVQSYMQEMAFTEDYESLSEVLAKTKTYQMKNGGDTLPSSFVYAAERLYAGPTHSVIVILLSALVLFILASLLSSKESIKRDTIVMAQVWTILAGLYLAVNWILRWIIGGHVPLDNNYGILLFLGFFMLLATVLSSKSPRMLCIGDIITGCVMAVAYLLCDTRINAVSAMLDTPLLGYHVAVIIISYALFAVIAINGAIGTIVKDKERKNKLRSISAHLLYPATFLLALGIGIGSIWAKTAWGAYWSWDPKETWALITLIVYCLGLFNKKIFFLKQDKYFHIYSMIAFLFVIFTYFGVNYLLKGMHSYV